MKKRFQELRCLIFIIYNVINNTCHRYTECNECVMKPTKSAINDEGNCAYHSRIENNIQMHELFDKAFYLDRCCDDNCKTCGINHLSSENSTCGFSMLADRIIKPSERTSK